MDIMKMIADYLRIAFAVLVTAATIFALFVIILCKFDLAISRLSLLIILAVSALCSCWLGWWTAK